MASTIVNAVNSWMSGGKDEVYVFYCSILHLLSMQTHTLIQFVIIKEYLQFSKPIHKQRQTDR